jgi:DNA-binding CsgD family transcriptional regulator
MPTRLTALRRPFRKTTISARRRFGLTPREEQILFWVAGGKTNAEIGKILGISSATVGKHLEHIYPKLGVENRTAAASFANELSHS